MRCRVYPLHRRGKRLPWREVQNSPVFEGELRTHYLAFAVFRYFVASLVRPGDALCQPILPSCGSRPSQRWRLGAGPARVWARGRGGCGSGVAVRDNHWRLLYRADNWFPTAEGR